MGTEEDVIRSRYAQLPADELIQLYKDGDLVEEAIPILVEEIKRRGCTIPSEDVVHQHAIEREKNTARRKAAIGSAVTSAILLFFYFLYQNGGYERIRDEWFPDTAAKAYIEEGTGFLQKHNYPKALALLGKAKECDSKNSEVYVALASAYMGLGQFTDVVACCEKAIEIKPDSGLAYGGLATAYVLLGEYGKAATCAERSLALFEQSLDSENARKAKILLIKIHEDRVNTLHR